MNTILTYVVNLKGHPILPKMLGKACKIFTLILTNGLQDSSSLASCLFDLRKSETTVRNDASHTVNVFKNIDIFAGKFL